MKKSAIFKIESLSAVDGDGLRCVIFMQGCNLRCGFCHNPESWDVDFEYDITAENLAQKVLRFSPYIKGGGVTFSGGEPLLHAEFIAKVCVILKREHINIAIETSASVINSNVQRLIDLCDCLMVDIKATSQLEFSSVTRTDVKISNVQKFLRYALDRSKDVRIRYVVVSGLNDTEKHMDDLIDFSQEFGITKWELLPFRKLCLDKYRELDIPFEYSKFEETDELTLRRLTAYVESVYEGKRLK